MNKILITLASFGEFSKAPLELLKKSGFRLISNTSCRRLNPQEIIKLGGRCCGIIAGVEKFDGDTLKALKDLRVISRVGAGVENINIPAARKLGIAVERTPDAPTQAVAEMTLALILNLIRNISFQDRQMHCGKWEKKIGVLLSDKTVGIVGLGRIGKRVAELLKGNCKKILATDISPDLGWANKSKIHIVSLRKLLAVSDILSLHVSGSKLIMGKSQFAQMKKGMYIVNTSRGDTLDEGALFEALRAGRVAGAALDVFRHEPYQGGLTQMHNVILTPHVASFAKESRIQMETEAVCNLLRALKQKKAK